MQTSTSSLLFLLVSELHGFKLKQIFNQRPIVSYKKEKSLKDILVRAKIPSIKQQSQNQ